MIEIFHVSDLHFGKSDDQNKKAQSLLDGIWQRYSFTDSNSRYLLVTGDITHDGTKEEYEFAKKALLPFKGRIFITPGNHDYGSWLGMAYCKKMAQYFDKPFAETLEFHHPFIGKRVFNCQLNTLNDKIMVIGLNSCRKVGITDISQGEIGESQRIELDELLRNADDQIPKIVFLHHIPHKDAVPKFIMTLRDWKELMAIISGKVDALAFGHQGKVLGTEQEGRTRSVSLHRPMVVRSLSIPGNRSLTKGLKQCTILDADSSVYEQAFYHIKVENNNLTVTVDKVNPIR
jgi:hypothetical protein